MRVISMQVSISDGTPAILMSLFLFFLPAKPYFVTGITSRNKDGITKEETDDSEDTSTSSSDIKKSVSDDIRPAGGPRFRNSPPLIDWATAQRLVAWEIIILVNGKGIWFFCDSNSKNNNKSSSSNNSSSNSNKSIKTAKVNNGNHSYKIVIINNQMYFFASLR